MISRAKGDNCCVLNNKAFIEQAERILDNHTISEHCFMFCADIADFQLINRYYGMEKGDELLKRAEAFLNKIPAVMLFKRVLSDQFIFMVVTQDPTTHEQIKNAFNRNVQTFLKEQKEAFPDLNIKIACGIYAMTSKNLLDAIDGANMARKESKKHGAASAMVYDHAALDAILDYHREEQVTALSLQNKRFTFFLQPKVNLLNGQIIGAEALARRVTPEGGVIYPDRFLSIMEGNGSIVELDILILEQVCEHIADRLSNGLPVVRTSVNLSRLHIQNPDTATRLHAIVDKHNIPPELIEFELTETILLNEFEDAKKLIDQLRGYQYHVSIDDFGAGYAGINIWQELNFDILKLDRKFLSDSEPIKSRNTAIVPNVINIAQRLGIDVICEGVETEEQCKYLLQLGCTAVQGFYFSRPVPKDEFYATYSEQHGKYPNPFNSRELSRGDKDQDGQRPAPRRKTFRQLLLTACCAIFLALCVVLTLSVYRGVVVNMFENSIENNLDSYTSGQAAIIDAKIKTITSTMQAFAILIAERNDEAFIDTYISALNENDPEVTYLFSTNEMFEQRIAAGEATAFDMIYIKELQAGKTITSDIVYSNRMGGLYCFSIGVPVMIDGRFVGGLRAVIHADLLTSIDLYISPYGKAEAAVLVDADGNILLPDGISGMYAGTSVFGLLRDSGFSENIQLAMRQALMDERGVHSFRAEYLDGIPYYVSVAELGYNGWHGVVLFKAENAQGIISTLLRHTIISVLVLMSAIILCTLLVGVVMQRWRKKADSNTQRYLLLEQFSDTVLFDYDCKHDIIRFTPNASKLFMVQDWTHEGFLARLASIPNIYPADCFAIEEAMSGNSPGDESEIRIRIKHPHDERYYWCLIQYKYIYDEHKQLVSIIGKIVDIDEQQRRENRLTGQALRDGLTELYNRTATQELIVERMRGGKPGLLFMIDVDDFKRLNDTYGHTAGDRILRAAADCLKQAFRVNDIIGRVGGDELLVYMHDVTDRDVLHQKMNNLWKLLRTYGEHLPMDMSLSVGVASFPDDGRTFEQVYNVADMAMYQAKQQGKRRYCYKGECHPFMAE